MRVTLVVVQGGSSAVARAEGLASCLGLIFCVWEAKTIYHAPPPTTSNRTTHHTGHTSSFEMLAHHDTSVSDYDLNRLNAHVVRLRKDKDHRHQQDHFETEVEREMLVIHKKLLIHEPVDLCLTGPHPF